MLISKQQALDYHNGTRPGKIEVTPTKPCRTQRDLSLAYTPGVAVPCLEIQKNPRLREQVELYITELLKSPVEELSGVGVTQAGRDFQKDVHNWNPCVPMWRRSPKE